MRKSVRRIVKALSSFSSRRKATEPDVIFIALLGVCCLGASPDLAQATEQAPDTMEARVMACAPCHGAKGEGTENSYFPRLARKPAGYLEKTT